MDLILNSSSQDCSNGLMTEIFKEKKSMENEIKLSLKSKSSQNFEEEFSSCQCQKNLME